MEYIILYHVIYIRLVKEDCIIVVSIYKKAAGRSSAAFFVFQYSILSFRSLRESLKKYILKESSDPRKSTTARIIAPISYKFQQGKELPGISVQGNMLPKNGPIYIPFSATKNNTIESRIMAPWNKKV
jgi:hypothetical protein